MRSSSRLFMAAILLTVAAGFASAQESSEPPPPPAPDVAVPVVPVVELPPIPCGGPRPGPQRTGRRPRAHAHHRSERSCRRARRGGDRRAARAGEASGHDDHARDEEDSEEARRNPEIEAREPFGPLPAAAAPVAAAPSKLDSLTPADAAASTVPAKSIAPAPAAVDSAIVETLPESTEPQTSLGIGGWLLAGIAVVAMVGLITWFRRRRTQRKISIVEFPQFSPELKPLPVSRLLASVV